MSADSARPVEALYDEHHPSLQRYLARLTGDPELAADVAQEAFVRLLEHHPVGSHARPWLFRVATNLVRDAARRRKTRRRLGTPERAMRSYSDPPGSPEDAVDRVTARSMIRHALDELSPKEQKALLMREEGFKHREIAEALGTTTGSVGTLLSRALKKAARGLAAAQEA
ncbi:MAG TPA: RNA polymerase sigma factor [Longimicrobiales bacterium]|nr:RNA polymerase sigma factor [Longimicrobiales bacterium]